MRGIPFAGPLSEKVSAYAYDITIFVSLRLDIKAVKKSVARHEQVAETKINFDKSEGLWHPVGVAFPCQGLSAGVAETSESSWCVSGPASNWSENGRKYRPREMPMWVPGFKGGCP